jgi:hypothetical protein
VLSQSRLLIGSLLSSLVCWGAHAELPRVEPTQRDFGTEAYAPDDPESWDNSGLGFDVDMYGNVAIAGAGGANYSTGDAGIYTRDSSGKWNRTATLVANDGKQFQYFGGHVALLDGRAVVSSKDAIYLFVRQASGVWVQKDKHTFAGASSVTDLDWQGNLLVVGVQGDTYPNYAFAYDSSQTNLLRKIARFAPADAVRSDGFGTRVAAYGSTVIATAPGYNNEQGAAYVYSCGTNTCTQTQKIISIGGKPGDQFGSAVDMNGTYLAIGAPGADQSGDEGAYQGGSAYVYTHSGKAWAQTQTLHPTPEEASNYGSFGSDLTIQGSRLLVTSPENGDDGYAEGLAFEYTLAGARWSPRALLSFGIAGFNSTSLIGEYAILGTPDPPHIHNASEIDFYKLP